MFDVLGDINWLAVVLATLAYYILGAIWFTPLFGKAWDESIGFDRPKEFKFKPEYYIVPLVSSFVVTIATAILMYALDVQELSDAFLLGLITGVGYALVISINNALTPKTPQPFRFGGIVGYYHLVGIVIVSLILFALK